MLANVKHNYKLCSKKKEQKLLKLQRSTFLCEHCEFYKQRLALKRIKTFKI